MSLLDEAFENFTVINRAVVDDGYGGTTTVWSDGATIKGAMVFDGSGLTKVAQALGVTATYTFTVRRNIDLDFQTVVRRNRDNKIFRLVSNSDDKKTPKSASLDMRQYSAEEWRLT